MDVEAEGHALLPLQYKNTAFMKTHRTQQAPGGFRLCKEQTQAPPDHV